MPKYLILLRTLLLSFCSPRTMPLTDPTEIDPATEVPAFLQTPDVHLDEITFIVIRDLATCLTLDPQQIRVISTEQTL